jgi:hypothetical protein
MRLTRLNPVPRRLTTPPLPAEPLINKLLAPAGTSACPNGKFYCRNVGHAPLVLNATLVDDGVCGG